MTKFGNYIKTLRTENGMTQAALADKLHVTDKAVSKWERGLSIPDIGIIPRLAELFEISVGDIISAIDEKEDPALITKVYQSSHDIRTPLHIMIGCADLADKHADDPDTRKRYLEIIKLSGQYLLEKYEQLGQASSPGTGMADDLTDYYRDHSDRAEMHRYNFIGKRVLIVDDIELNREIAGEIVRQTGADAEYAGDGEACLDMIRQAPAGHYDLVLMDISMPAMDGTEATRYIRQLSDPAKACIPIVAMTANVGEKDRRDAFEAGMNGFAEKPIDTGKLYAVMAELMKNGRGVIHE